MGWINNHFILAKMKSWLINIIKVKTDRFQCDLSGSSYGMILSCRQTKTLLAEGSILFDGGLIFFDLADYRSTFGHLNTCETAKVLRRFPGKRCFPPRVSIWVQARRLLPSKPIQKTVVLTTGCTQ